MVFLTCHGWYFLAYNLKKFTNIKYLSFSQTAPICILFPPFHLIAFVQIDYLHLLTFKGPVPFSIYPLNYFLPGLLTLHSLVLICNWWLAPSWFSLLLLLFLWACPVLSSLLWLYFSWLVLVFKYQSYAGNTKIYSPNLYSELLIYIFEII